VLVYKLSGIVDCGEVLAWRLGKLANTLTNRRSANASISLVVKTNRI